MMTMIKKKHDKIFEMKNASFYVIRFVILTGLISTSFSCEYREYADAEYVGQLIYMPAANHNIYEITEQSSKPSAHPTDGSQYRYQVDEAAGRLVIPLGVYRGGIEREGEVAVDIMTNMDTISNLMTQGMLDSTVVILPGEQYELPEMVLVEDGADFMGFDLNVDLGFLKSMHQEDPGKKYAIGVEIYSADPPVNEELKTTLIVIDTKVATP